MSEEANKSADPAASEDGYVSPAIESVVTSEELEREVHYAGNELSVKGA